MSASSVHIPTVTAKKLQRRFFGALYVRDHLAPMVSAVRFRVAILVARLLTTLIRLSRLGAATSLPGLVALKICPTLLRSVTANRNVIVVSGTNGKTSTTHLIAAILRSQAEVCCNDAGANLLGGIASALISGLATLSANCHIVLEVDEMCLDDVVAHCSPAILVITNVGRDQLDRFGEVDCALEHLKAGISALSPSGIAVLNADDPNIAAAVDGSCTNVKWYGSAGTAAGNAGSWNVDARSCPRCRSELNYGGSRYWCPACDFSSPDAVVRFDRIVNVSPVEAYFHGIAIKSQMLGTAGAYNVLASIIATAEAGVLLTDAASALPNIAPPLGRGRTVLIDEMPVTILLSKNPSSFALNLIEISSTDAPRAVVVAVNDRHADGQDVSWLWDVPFELLNREHFEIAAAGLRAPDVAVRLKYADVHFSVCMYDVLEAIRAVRQSGRPAPVFLCCTYSVLLDLWKGRAVPALT